MWEPKTYDASRFNDIIEMSIENYGKENDICDSAFLKHQYFENPAGDALIELAVDPENACRSVCCPASEDQGIWKRREVCYILEYTYEEGLSRTKNLC